MAREHARVWLSIWLDEDFRALTPPAQHLYFVLLTSPDLSYCGVADWRPGRIAARSGSWQVPQLAAAAAELSKARFVVIDESTEEVLLRSFVRHDGVMKESRMAVSMVKAFAAVASTTLRGVVVHELRRLHDEEPKLNGWLTTAGKPGQALDLLPLTPIAAADLDPYLPVGLGVGLAQTPDGIWGSVSGSTSPAPTPAPTPSPNGEAPQEPTPRKRGARINADFTPSEDLRDWALDRGFTQERIDEITEEFVDYWAGVSGAKGVKLDWDGTWRNNMRRQDPQTGRPALRAVVGGAGPRQQAEAEGREYKPWEDY